MHTTCVSQGKGLQHGCTWFSLFALRKSNPNSSMATKSNTGVTQQHKLVSDLLLCSTVAWLIVELGLYVSFDCAIDLL